MNLAGRRVWVTGGSAGIGAALVAELAARGCRVVASARRLELLEQLAGEHSGVTAIACDVTDRDAMRATAERITAELGGIDIAVLNAGHWRQNDAADWDGDLFRSTVETNLMGTAHGIEAVLGQMRRQGGGTIVGVASLAGVRGLPHSAAYGATKAAQINLLESLRIDLRPLGIRVQTVCPGFVRTDLTAHNRFPMPFLIEPAAAARRIVRGIQRGSPVIAFPLPMVIGVQMGRLVPAGIYSAVLGRSGARGGRRDRASDRSG